MRKKQTSGVEKVYTSLHFSIHDIYTKNNKQKKVYTKVALENNERVCVEQRTKLLCTPGATVYAKRTNL